MVRASPSVQVVPLNTRSRASKQRHAAVEQVGGAKRRHRLARQRSRDRRRPRPPAGAHRRTRGRPPPRAAGLPARARRASMTCLSPSRMTFARGGRYCGESLDRPLGLQLLDEGEQRVDEDDDDDGDRHRSDPDQRGQAGGGPQQQGQGMRELARQLPRPAPPAAAAQLVGSELDQAPIRLAAGEAAAGAAQVPQQQVDSLGRIDWRRHGRPPEGSVGGPRAPSTSSMRSVLSRSRAGAPAGRGGCSAAPP